MSEYSIEDLRMNYSFNSHLTNILINNCYNFFFNFCLSVRQTSKYDPSRKAI